MNYIRIPTSAFICEKCHDITAFVNGRMFYKKKHVWNLTFFSSNYIQHILIIRTYLGFKKYHGRKISRQNRLRETVVKHDESVRHSCHDHCHNCWSCLSCHVIFDIQWNHFLRVRAKFRFSLSKKLLTFITSHSFLEHFCTIWMKNI